MSNSSDRDPFSSDRLFIFRSKRGSPSTRRRRRIPLTPGRSIKSIYVAPLHEMSRNSVDVAQAIAFIESYDESKSVASLTRYEVGVRYTNGDEIRGQFKDKKTAVAFLRGMH